MTTLTALAGKAVLATTTTRISIRTLSGYLSPAALALGLALSQGPSAAQTRQILFDGKTLGGWHTQGEAVWTVRDGAIQAQNPKMDWAHLVSDQSFGNGIVRLKYLNKSGNSGLYVRGTEGGAYMMQGMQVDFGTTWDGAVMRVTDSTWGWVEEVTKASDSGWAKAGQWNELAVDMQGGGLKTYINGRLVWQSAHVAGMAASGRLAIQLHDGDANEIAYKDIEILISPTGLISEARRLISQDPRLRSKDPLLLFTDSRFMLSAPDGSSEKFNLKGARLPDLVIARKKGE